MKKLETFGRIFHRGSKFSAMFPYIKDNGNSILYNIKILSIQSSKLCCSLMRRERNQDHFLALLVNTKGLRENSLLSSFLFVSPNILIANFQSLRVHC